MRQTFKWLSSESVSHIDSKNDATPTADHSELAKSTYRTTVTLLLLFLEHQNAPVYLCIKTICGHTNCKYCCHVNVLSTLDCVGHCKLQSDFSLHIVIQVIPLPCKYIPRIWNQISIPVFIKAMAKNQCYIMLCRKLSSISPPKTNQLFLVPRPTCLQYLIKIL